MPLLVSKMVTFKMQRNDLNHKEWIWGLVVTNIYSILPNFGIPNMLKANICGWNLASLETKMSGKKTCD